MPAKPIIVIIRLSSLLTCMVACLVLILMPIPMSANIQSTSQQNLLDHNFRDSVLQITPTPDITSDVASSLQVTATLPITASVGDASPYLFSLDSLGYDEAQLESPGDSVEYFFRMPASWVMAGDGLLSLDISYLYNQFEAESTPTIFGDLIITLNNETLDIIPIEESELDRFRLTVPLPESVLNDPDRTGHTIGVEFRSTKFLCRIPHTATLIIHPTSSVLLNYDTRPLVPDLSNYPLPFYQRSFDRDLVRFVLPAQPTSNDLTTAVGVAAKLNDLSNNDIVITSTTDIEFRDNLTTSTTIINEHLFIIGTPQVNQLVPLLNETTQLPASLHQQQLTMMTQGPSIIAPGDTFTYTTTITNSTEQPTSLSPINSLSSFYTLIECTPNCTEENNEEGEIIWDAQRLAPDEQMTLILTLRATDTLSGTLFENRITVNGNDLSPLGGDTVTTTIASDSSSNEQKMSIVNKDDYFFLYNERVVAKEDGIIQEILAPDNPNQVILLITGLNDNAVRKAGQALSSDLRLPGLSGQVAFVREALSPLEVQDSDASPEIDVTFADLNYADEIISGESSNANYFFDVPPGWQLDDNASFDLYFNHSRLIEYENSGVTLLLNREPIASMPLTEETATKGHLQINLGEIAVRPLSNRLTVQVSLALPEDECEGLEEDQGWFRVMDSSRLFLSHTDTGQRLDLNQYPYPFNSNQSLKDLLLALPESPTVEEWHLALELAASLGNLTGGKTMIPSVLIGDDLSDDIISDYHIIALGRPSTNPLIQQINRQLPQPFLPNSDIIEQRLDDIVLRLPPDISLGFLQLLPAPWNEEKAFLAVTGTTDEAVNQAVLTLIERRWGLDGNLVFIKEDESRNLDTRTIPRRGLANVVATTVPEITSMTTTVTATITSSTTVATPPAITNATQENVNTSSTRTQRPGWLIPLVGVNGLIVISILAFIFWRSQLRK